MEQAGQSEQIHTLLREETPIGRNSRYQVCERSGQRDIYRAEVEQAWYLAEETLANEFSARMLGLQIRYALITVSLNGLQGSPTTSSVPLPTPLIDDKHNQIAALAGLAPYLPERLLREASTLAFTIKTDSTGNPLSLEKEYHRCRALTALLPSLAAAGYPGEALELVRQIKIQATQAEVLSQLILYLSTPLLLESVLLARKMTWGKTRALLLAEIASRLPNPDQDILQQEALVETRSLEKAQWRAEALMKVSAYFSQPKQEELLSEALTIALQAETIEVQAEILYKIGPHLSEPLLRQALEAAEKLPWLNNEYRDDWPVQAWVLQKLKPRLAKLGYVEEARQVRVGLPGRDLAGIVPYLSEVELRQALEEAQTLPLHNPFIGDDPRWEALSSIAPRLAELGYPEEALAITLQIDPDENLYANTLVLLIPYLSEPLLKEMVSTIPKMGIWGRQKVLATLVPHLGAWPKSNLRKWWMEEGQSLLHSLSHRIYTQKTPRQNLLSDVSALAPLLIALGGEDVAEEIFQAIQEVGRWWP